MIVQCRAAAAPREREQAPPRRLEQVGQRQSSLESARASRARDHSEYGQRGSAGDPNVRAAQQATKTIPILAIAEDLVGSGFVASLARPACSSYPPWVDVLMMHLKGH
jgi:hypothetical protein